MGASRERRKATLPKFCLDYQELKSKPTIKPEGEAATESADSVLRIVVGKDEPTGMLAFHKVDTKGPIGEWTEKRLVKDIEEVGRV